MVADVVAASLPSWDRRGARRVLAVSHLMEILSECCGHTPTEQVELVYCFLLEYVSFAGYNPTCSKATGAPVD